MTEIVEHRFPFELKEGQKVRVINNKSSLYGDHKKFAGKIVTVDKDKVVTHGYSRIFIKEFSFMCTSLSRILANRLKVGSILDDNLFQL